MSVRGRKSKDEEIYPYKDIIHKMYWEDKLSFSEISKRLNLCSGPTLYRYMKKNDIVRTHREQLEDLRKSNTGRTWTEETRRNVSEGVKRSYQNNKELRKIRSRDNYKRWAKLTKEERLEKCRKFLTAGQIQAQKKNITSIEIKMKEEFDKFGLDYIQQFPLCNGKFIVDFYVPSNRMIIECNGEYWHRLPERIKRDEKLRKFAKAMGIKLAFAWENDINRNSKEAFINAIWEAR